MRKHLLALPLSLGLLLASCNSLSPSQITPGTADDGIVLMTQFPVYAPDVPFIQFSITNNTGDTAEYGTEWTLERLEDDIWCTVPFKPNVGWTQPLYMLSDGGTTSDTAHLSVLDHKFKDGTYRIVKEINDTFYTAEFAIGDSPVGEDSPYGYQPLDSLPASYTADMAVEDGVVLLSDDTDFSRFFYEMSIGMNTQLRYAQPDNDGILPLSDLTAEIALGQCRIRYTVGETDSPLYFSYIITDGKQIALSNYPTWQEDDLTRLILPELAGNASILDTCQPEDEIAIARYCAAAFWSEDGTQLLTLHPDAENPLDFGLSQLYEGGGSSGSMHTIDTPGMKAIRGALWTGENQVMLICETDSNLDNMTGYVFFDTEKNEVIGYTQSQYAPHFDEDGGMLIPE